MRAVGLHADVIVFISRAWQTTCVAVRGGEEGFVIDSPVFPDELAALPGVLEQAGFPVSGLLATHADWDHLLGRLAFAEAPLGCGESTARRLGAELGAVQRELRNFDEEHYVVRERPLALAGVQSLPVPGRLDLGSARIELHPAEGHTVDGTAYLMPWLGLLVCGDYLSPVEIPVVETADAYSATLGRLRPLVERVETVVPGHGQPLSRDEALALLAEDAAYVEALRRHGEQAPLPPNRNSRAQRKLHAENAENARKGTV